MQHDQSASDEGLPDEQGMHVAARIRDGLLPGTAPMRIYAANGSGWPCAVCDREIPRDDDGENRIFLVHHACYEVWESARERGLRQPTA